MRPPIFSLNFSHSTIGLRNIPVGGRCGVVILCVVYDEPGL